ncbi:Flagellin family protein [Ligilactobacillus ruminis ATCC 27782]|uniref:Flagellin family protein n=1 Tax=Ligilactobacillus ruminis (strain ATCC 27782 / RF3) TaxID=1069534 RepID=G2SML4_LIGR2|nr:Flagellin family protein [Ligilactobacillus ruminis ATCC 27782]
MQVLYFDAKKTFSFLGKSFLALKQVFVADI